MGSGTDVLPQCTSVDNGYSRDQCMPPMEEDDETEDSDNINQPKAAKLPRNYQPMRQCISQAIHCLAPLISNQSRWRGKLYCCKFTPNKSDSLLFICVQEDPQTDGAHYLPHQLNTILNLMLLHLWCMWVRCISFTMRRGYGYQWQMALVILYHIHHMSSQIHCLQSASSHHPLTVIPLYQSTTTL